MYVYVYVYIYIYIPRKTGCLWRARVKFNRISDERYSKKTFYRRVQKTCKIWCHLAAEA